MNIDKSIYMPSEEHHSKGQPCEGGTYVYLEDDLYVCNKCGKLFKFYNEVNFMTIQEQIEKLRQDIKNTNELFNTQLAALEKQLKAEEQKKSSIWKPKVDEMYYYIAFDGSLGLYRYEDDYVDEACLALDNCFETKEAAEWEKQHRIVATELKHFVQENDPRPIMEEDWGNSCVRKHYIYYDCEAREIFFSYKNADKNANQVYASTDEVLEKAIEHIGEERLKKYYFGVK